jgi:hypothetical protein
MKAVIGAEARRERGKKGERAVVNEAQASHDFGSAHAHVPVDRLHPSPTPAIEYWWSRKPFTTTTPPKEESEEEAGRVHSPCGGITNRTGGVSARGNVTDDPNHAQVKQ